jgi:hypothetical protein
VIIAPGEKVFGALLAIVGAVIILTGHWATTDDLIADLFTMPAPAISTVAASATSIH